MNFTFLDAVGQQGDPHRWEVTSRGIDAHPSDPMCGLATEMISGLPGGAEFALKQRARAFTTRSASAQELILTATRDERGVIGFQAPALRARTFTLREAIWLGQAEVTDAELERAWGALASRSMTALQAYADLLHRRRGVTAFRRETLGSAFWFRQTDRHELDVTDRHAASARLHAESLNRVRDYTKLFAWQLLGSLRTFDRTGPSERLRAK
jgi:protein-tyrosine-phosphatase